LFIPIYVSVVSMRPRLGNPKGLTGRIEGAVLLLMILILTLISVLVLIGPGVAHRVQDGE
jgi:hypothetical protein